VNGFMPRNLLMAMFFGGLELVTALLQTERVPWQVFLHVELMTRPYSLTPSLSQTSEYFLEMFRNNLLDVGIDPIPYGTHSFRRGGCQWMSVDLTIVKYLISWNDNPMQKREDFFNFNRVPMLKCWTCGRSCRCA